MPHKLPKHVKRVRSKGKDYFYFDTGQRLDGKRIYRRLPDLRDPSFGGALAAMQGHRNRAKPVDIVRVPKLIDLYQKSGEYGDLTASSKRIYDIYLARLASLLPTAPVGELERKDIQVLFDNMGETPGAANMFLAVTASLLKWGRARDYLKTNPCDDIKPHKLGEHKPWPEAILQAALKTKKARVRLLVHLLYYTAQRINDVLDMTWNDVVGDELQVRQRKTGKEYRIPLHKALRDELKRTPKRGLTIVTSATGMRLGEDTARDELKAFVATFGVKRVPHGLRKNAVIALLEVGCSVAETAAISGQSLKMVEHYAKERDRRKLASAAILRWEGNAS